jgi:purine-binding chemotaxis protein CheW
VDQREREILVFEVDGRRFGLPAAEVRELLRAVAIVPLPLAGPAVEGVVNLRGRVVPVLDLRARLGLPARAVAPSDHLIVAQSEGRLVALRVDRALDLVRLDAGPCAEGEAEGPRVARLADGLAPLLDLRALLGGGGALEAFGATMSMTGANGAAGREGEGAS